MPSPPHWPISGFPAPDWGSPDPATVPRVDDLEGAVDAVAAATGFSGVVRVDRGDRVELAKAYGWAHRGLRVPNTVDTRFGIASGTKTLTALTVVSLIETGHLGLATTAR